MKGENMNRCPECGEPEFGDWWNDYEPGATHLWTSEERRCRNCDFWTFEITGVCLGAAGDLSWRQLENLSVPTLVPSVE